MNANPVTLMEDLEQVQQVPSIYLISEDVPPFQSAPENMIPAIRDGCPQGSRHARSSPEASPQGKPNVECRALTPNQYDAG